MSFPRYPEYKDIGIEWIGEVPVSWKNVRLKDLVALVMGQSPNSEDCNQDGLGEPFLQGNAEFGSTNPVAKQFCISAKKFSKPGDLLFSVRAPVGALNRSDSAYGIGRGLCALRSKNRRIMDFVWWYLPAAKNYLQSISTGSTFEAISVEQVGNLPLAIPYDQREQAQIGRFLDHETTKIDALIREQERLIKLLEEKRQAVISHAVTKGLDPDVPMKDSGVEWLGEVPAHWITKSYRYATTIFRGKFGHRPRNDPSLYEGDYPFIQTGDIAQADKEIHRYKQTLNKHGASVSQLFPAGTLVMAIAANIGDTAILGFEAYAPDSVVGFRPTRDISLEFLRYSLLAAIQELEKTATQSTQANLNIDRVGSVKAVFPPDLAEQSRIATFLDRSVERYSALQGQAERSITLMTERRSALISAAVTGKIDVRNWQPPIESTFTGPADAKEEAMA